MNPQDLPDVFDLAMQRGKELVEEMNARFVTDGVTAFEAQFKSEAEFLNWVAYLQQTPSPQFSTWSFLPTVSPDLYATLNHRFQTASAKAMGVR